MSAAGKSRAIHRRQIGLRPLEVFVTVAEAGNMTVAATRLAMTQPAVSQIIKQLEQEIGGPLLDRKLRPLRLTPAGASLLARAQQLLGDANRLYREVRQASDAVLPRLRIGLVDSFAATAGPQLVKSLRDSVEQLQVWSGIGPELREEFIGRELDLIICPDPLDGIEGVENRRVLQESFIVVLPASFKRSCLTLSLAELAQRHALVRFSSRSLMGAQIERHLRWQRIEAPRRLEFDSSEAVLAMVAEGIGWAILTPLTLAQVPTAFSRILPMPLPGAALSRSLYVVYRAGEFGELPERIARHCMQVFNTDVGTRLRTLAGWLPDHFVAR